MALNPLRIEDEKPPRPAAPGKKWVRVTKAVNGIDTEVWEEVADDTGGPQWGARESMRLISREIPRVDGPDKVTGRATFSHDVRLPGMAYARVLRSRVPAAKVKLDLEPARKIPGVLAVVELGEGEVRMRTWERGSGATQACGTGACAVAVAGIVTGRLRSPVLVHLPGGELRIAWEGGGAGVMMTGPAVEVFEGKLDLGAWPRGGREGCA